MNYSFSLTSAQILNKTHFALKINNLRELYGNTHPYANFISAKFSHFLHRFSSFPKDSNFKNNLCNILCVRVTNKSSKHSDQLTCHYLWQSCSQLTASVWNLVRHILIMALCQANTVENYAPLFRNFVPRKRKTLHVRNHSPAFPPPLPPSPLSRSDCAKFLGINL